MSLKTPDVTPVQLIVGALTAVITAVIGVVNSFGWANITVDQSAKLLGLWAALGGLAVIADAIIRHGRSTGTAAVPPPIVPTTLATKKRAAVRRP